MNPFEQNKFLNHVHRNVDIEKNQEILFADTTIGGLQFLPLYRACIAQSYTEVDTWKVFRRAQRALSLARYFDHSLTIQGARVECGVLRGFFSLLLARVAQMRDGGFDGSGFHLVDSFAGLSPPTKADAIGTKSLPNGETQPVYAQEAGHFAASIDHVRAVMAEYPETGIHKGWIPAVFSALPETAWSFVHVDVDLYEPTKACLEYFLPRLAPGGVIVNDDFSSPLFPGGGHGWHQVMESRGLSYVVLDTGQAVYVH